MRDAYRNAWNALAKLCNAKGIMEPGRTLFGVDAQFPLLRTKPELFAEKLAAAKSIAQTQGILAHEDGYISQAKREAEQLFDKLAALHAEYHAPDVSQQSSPGASRF